MFHQVSLYEWQSEAIKEARIHFNSLLVTRHKDVQRWYNLSLIGSTVIE